MAMITVTPPKVSGSKRWCICVADTEAELARLAEKLHEHIHHKGAQRPHLDLNEHKRRLAIQMGAREMSDASIS